MRSTRTQPQPIATLFLDFWQPRTVLNLCGVSPVNAVVMLQSKFMGVQYQLVNMTKRECISFTHMDGTKMKELAGNPAQASIVTWYLLNNQGDNIQFISDTYNEWPFNIGKRGDESGFKDVTMKYIDILIGQKILRNDGMLYVDEEEPDNIYIFNLKNIWLE